MSGAQSPEPRQIGARTELDGAPMSSTIGFEHPCFGCKYSLKGLSLDSVCPECGKPVTESLRRDLLRFADPAYVKRLKSGAIFVTAATCLPPIGMCIIAPITIFMSAASGPTTTVTTSSGSTTVYTSSASAAPSPVAIALQAVFLLILWVLFSFGWYRLAAPDPQETPGSNVSAGRRTCRRLTVAYAVTAVASTVIPPPELLDPGSVLNAVGHGLTLVSLVLFMLLLVYGFRNLKRTANRIPAPGLAKLTGVTFWSGAVTIAMFIGLYVLLFTAYGAASTFSRPGASSMLAFILFAGLGIGGALAGLTSYILSVVLFSSLWGRLRRVSGDGAINGTA